jgi:hypothetical protein
VSLRDAISRNPRTGAAAAVGLLLAGITIIFLQMPRRSAAADHAQSFFTVDDGKTWFADSATNLAPFDKDGKLAVRAHVYRCADGTKFVNYLERFKPDAKRTLENLSTPDPSRKVSPDFNAIRNAYTGGREVKRPGDANWVGTDDFREAARVTAVKCPDGSTQAVAVEP